jgi:hypothetical protein
MSMGSEGIISGLDIGSSGMVIARDLGRCTIEKPSSSLDESISKLVFTTECFGLYTSVEGPEIIEEHCVVASSVLFHSLSFPFLDGFKMSRMRSAAVA